MLGMGHGMAFAGWRLGQLVEKYVLGYIRVLFLIALAAFHTLQWFQLYFAAGMAHVEPWLTQSKCW